MTRLRIGEEVTLAELPSWVEDLPAESRAVFQFCLGRTYPVSGITDDGLVILDVSADVDRRFGGYANDLRVEPVYLRRGP
ncbi:MAG: hypothetical protein V3V17_00100 [Alphaproteobacteria bacterium]